MRTPPQGSPTLPHSRIQTSAFVQQNLFHCIHASTFTPPHSLRTYAAAFTPHPYAAALTPPHLSCRAQTALTLQRSRSSILSPLSRCSIYAAALTPPHFCRRMHGAASMLPLSRPCIHAATLMLQHSHSSTLSLLSRHSIDAVALTMP